MLHNYGVQISLAVSSSKHSDRQGSVMTTCEVTFIQLYVFNDSRKWMHTVKVNSHTAAAIYMILLKLES